MYSAVLSLIARHRGPRCVAILTLVLSLSACVSVPPPGEHFVMKVSKIPTERHQLQGHPGLSLAIASGVTRDDVKAGRLWISSCGLEPDGERRWVSERHGYVLLPEAMTLMEGDVIEVEARAPGGTAMPYERFFGRYLGPAKAHDDDYFINPYDPDGRELRRGPISPNRMMRVEVYSPLKGWQYDHAAAESRRNALITDDELNRGRIAMGVCSPGVDAWTYWKVRLPDGLNVQPGDYIEAVAGSYEAPRSVGPLSTALRKVAPPPEGDFIFTQGSMTVSCQARARALE